MAVEFGLRWGVIFRKDGTDIEAMKNYFIEKGTRVDHIVEDILTIGDHLTDIDEEVPCVIFCLETKDTIFVPFGIRRELNLQETETEYLFMPIER